MVVVVLLLLLLLLVKSSVVVGGGPTTAVVVATCQLGADDCTSELMAAFNRPGVERVVVPSAPRAVWPVSLPLEMSNATASHRRVIFQPGVTIEAKRGAFKGVGSSCPAAVSSSFLNLLTASATNRAPTRCSR
jgi:hypothetical protein